jgi:hypothetical protein
MESSDRSEYLGAHVTTIAKDYLRVEAKKQDVSMSQLVSDWVEEKLHSLGYNLDEARPQEFERPLPFDRIEREIAS